jgi:two-component system, NarL family, nitrate/nitrite response regulator NarL
VALHIAASTSDRVAMEGNDQAPIRVVLLDDHDVARQQSVARLRQNPQLDIVGDVADAAEALRLVNSIHPDAVLVETRRTDQRGIEAIAMFSSLDEELRPAIVAYLEILHRDEWPQAQAAGADDLLLNEMRPESVAKELRHIISRVRRNVRTA